MNEETRDEAGRLVSVVVDGQRFHRAAGVNGLDCGCVLFPNGTMRQPCPPHEAAYRYREERDQAEADLQAAIAERDSLRVTSAEAYEHNLRLVAELSSLRGVVQAAQDLAEQWKKHAYSMALAGGESPRPLDYSEGHYVGMLKGYDERAAELRSVLAAAADAPQPETDVWERNPIYAPPSPAVLPQTPETKDQR